MPTNEDISERIMEEAVKVQEEYGIEAAVMWLAGVQWAVLFQYELAASPHPEAETSDLFMDLGKFYSELKGEIS